MGIFFGTDGIRGVACEELTYDLAYKCGNAVAQTKENAKIVIGQDTRTSGSFITTAFSLGAISLGANVIDVGVCTTPAVAYLTKTLKADFGVMISASHNPAEYNGIKIFDGQGFKLGDEKESKLERKFINQKVLPYDKLGFYEQKFELAHLYLNHLKKNIQVGFDGIRVVLDAGCGGAYKIAPQIFRKLGAEVIELNCTKNGLNINNNSGALHPEHLAECVVKNNASFGFAFDGDADRIIAVDEHGNILDGDLIMFILAKHFKQNGKLNKNMVVGTRHTNMGLEKELENLGIELIRTDIGDKYVLEKMLEQNLNLGGEKSGHIIIANHSTTGDGILTALSITQIAVEQGLPLSKLANVCLYPQENIDVVVADKMRIINSEELSKVVEEQEKFLGADGRIMVRVSGTEPKIRIMVESAYKEKNIACATEIERVVKKINGESVCAE